MLRNRKYAFTLIELLVVISIIGLLLGITAPVLTRAKNSARAIVCRNNFKQAGIGFSIYQTEHKGFMVTSYYAKDGNTSVGTVTWWSIMMWEDIIPDTKILLCPSLRLADKKEKVVYSKADLETGKLNKQSWRPGPYGDPWYGSYGNILATDSSGNTLLSYPSIGQGEGSPFKVSQCVRNPSSEILLLDCVQPPEFISYTWDAWIEAGATPYADPRAMENGWSNVWMRHTGAEGTIGFSVRHKWASNALYFDGHSELKDGKTLWEQDWSVKGGNPMNGF